MKYASVTEVVRRIKTDLQKDYWLQSIAMEGSIIGLKRAVNGHYYMNIHDETCSIRAIFFRGRVGRMMDGIREGDHVVVIGAVNIYEKGGALSFIIERLFSQGMGALQAQYERIKTELLQAGYFDPAHKRPVPRFPWSIGVLTSPAGAVLHDIQKIARERNPLVSIRLYPIPVQGDGAEENIAEVLQTAGRNKRLDVLILARGGGSMEDLWCFNSPAVVKAVYASAVPVITAIGHETDTTLADYAADVRAATPTHAAELAFPSLNDIEMSLAAMSEQAYQSVMGRIGVCRKDLDRIASQVQPLRYQQFLSAKAEDIAHLRETGNNRLSLALSKKQGQFAALQSALQAMNPIALVRRGYGQLEQDGHIISHIQDIAINKPLQVQLIDGRIMTEIKEVQKYGKNNG